MHDESLIEWGHLGGVIKNQKVEGGNLRIIIVCIWDGWGTGVPEDTTLLKLEVGNPN